MDSIYRKTLPASVLCPGVAGPAGAEGLTRIICLRFFPRDDGISFGNLNRDDRQLYEIWNKKAGPSLYPQASPHAFYSRDSGTARKPASALNGIFLRKACPRKNFRGIASPAADSPGHLFFSLGKPIEAVFFLERQQHRRRIGPMGPGYRDRWFCSSKSIPWIKIRFFIAVLSLKVRSF